MIGFDIISFLAIVWIFAWLKDIRNDTRKIREVLKKRFPEDFADEE